MTKWKQLFQDKNNFIAEIIKDFPTTDKFHVAKKSMPYLISDYFYRLDNKFLTLDQISKKYRNSRNYIQHQPALKNIFEEIYGVKRVAFISSQSKIALANAGNTLPKPSKEKIKNVKKGSFFDHTRAEYVKNKHILSQLYQDAHIKGERRPTYTIENLGDKFEAMYG